MELLAYLTRELKYNAWANIECLNSLTAADSALPRALRLMAHIVGAESLWLCRLTKQDSSIPVWPEWSIEECEAQSSNISQAWSEYLHELTPQRLAESASYTNSKGEPWSSTVQDVITHVALHSSYHRGQIASDLRQNGFAPAYTDFIHSIRTGLLE